MRSSLSASHGRYFTGLAMLALALAIVTAWLALTASAQTDWESDWAVDGPFALEIDATGFSLPTAMAFVREPGPNPKDPLYFVVELHGSVKLITNDRTVLDFASVPTVIPDVELPDPSAQLGAAGVCLDHINGYVFITFASRREGGTLGNRLVRFTTAPKTFAATYTEVREIASIIGTEQSAPSHQIGACAVDGEDLLVGIGDGRDISASGRNDTLLGKVLAMDLDGRPLPGNPFAADGSEAARYVYASGFRNPFALGVFEGLVTVIDNGISIDRLVLAQPGVDYLWDGSDTSIAASATAVLDPAGGAVHLDRGTPEGFLGDGIFYSTSSQDEGIGGLWFLPLDFESGHTTGKTSQVVQYLGGDFPAVTAVATGPDGIYFTPLAPASAPSSSVLKLVHRPDHSHPIAIEPPRQDLFTHLGCVTCHEREGVGGDVGPSLDFFHEENRNRVLSKLQSEGFEEMLRQLDTRIDEPFVSTRDARAEVLSLSGLARLNAYVRNKALEPRFADPNSVMPQLGLTEQQAAAVASELASPWEIRVSDVERILRRVFPLPETRVGDLILGSIAGGIAVAFAMSLLRVGRRIAKRRRGPSPEPPY